MDNSIHSNKDVYMVFGGKTGWIGQMIVQLLEAEDCNSVYLPNCRLEDTNLLSKELDEVRPKYIINCGGVTGRPNVDWCEDHKQETIRSNVIGTLTLVDVAYQRNIHVTNFATGCIYEYDAEHTMDENGKGFTEEDKPNFSASFYSKTKAAVEEMLKNYPNVLTLRVRVPLSDDLHARNFITKITKYQKVVNVPNSMTILNEMIPIAIDMTEKDLKGIFNFTNPGVVSHNEILQLYKEYIDPDFKWQNFSLEEQAKILKAGRSNNKLDVSKLLKYYPKLTPIKDAMPLLFKRMKEKMDKEKAEKANSK